MKIECPYCNSKNTMLREIVDSFFESSSATAAWVARCNDCGKYFYVHFNYAMTDFSIEPIDEEDE